MRISFFYVHTIEHPVHTIGIYTIVYIVLIKEYQPTTRPTPELTSLGVLESAERGKIRGVLRGFIAHAVRLYHPIGVNPSIKG